MPHNLMQKGFCQPPVGCQYRIRYLSTCHAATHTVLVMQTTKHTPPDVDRLRQLGRRRAAAY